ncbi:magnesium-translocating P-type ATPase [Plantibacter sp. Mn2098]|uniref:magnesium-translocating P-type ATPase n=1 Tax=Plantibacter sp. Mn2098 TaxID=3395266 RepID=UPI003BD86B83
MNTIRSLTGLETDLSTLTQGPPGTAPRPNKNAGKNSGKNTGRNRTKKRAGTDTNTLLDQSQRALLRNAATAPVADTVRRFGVGRDGADLIGLTPDTVEKRLDEYGENVVGHHKPAPAIIQFLMAFTNPFILILLFLVTIIYFTDVVFADPADGPSYEGVITIGTMVLISVILRFWQEYSTGRSAEALLAMVRTTAAITRSHAGVPVTRELPIEQVVPGDVVQLAAGDMIPADVLIVRAKDLQINQAMLTGESLPSEKSAQVQTALADTDLLGATNLGFMGTSVVSGSGTAIILATGQNTYFGSMSASIVGKRPETSFDIGIRKVSILLIQFMVVMVSIVFIVNGLTKDWGSAFLFGVSVAVGLTPEMLPLIVTANLAKGARFMAKRKVVVKRLNSIQNFGAMDVLCTDKTGTLTEDRIVLERHINVFGRSSETTLGLAAANAHFQTGLRNLLDQAVLDVAGPGELERITAEYTLIDEMPFDFVRRRMSVVLDDGLSHLIVTKGAVEEVLALCTTEQVKLGAAGRTAPLTPERLREITDLVAEENRMGLRVLAVATRSIAAEMQDGADGTLGAAGTDGIDPNVYSTADETEMTLVGFLSFLDPPKASAKDAIASLERHGTQVKVITGDNELVAATVCRTVGIDVGEIVLGSQIDELNDEELTALALRSTVFAKMDPLQKARIVEAMRDGGQTVGFLGDGINDAAALRAADVGISVDTAVDIAKESADIILLEKDLTVLEGGVVEGRRTFANTMKYIKMTASSNFGNMFSVLVASAMLPFLPMIPLVVLVQNLTYDLSMLTLPWDKVDKEYLKKPRKWESKSLARFMVFIGPISSIFDISTFALMWFVFGANSPEHAALFQSGWFIESIISQTLIVHMLRTEKIPFIQSRASLPVMLATGAVCLFGLVLPFTGLGASFGLVPLPWTYFPFLLLTLAVYCALTQFIKVKFIKKYGSWL